MRRTAVLLTLATLAFTAACSDAPTAAPMAEEPEAPAGPVIRVTSEEAAAFATMLADINVRVLPSLANASVAAELQGHIAALSAAITAGNAKDAAAAHAGAKAVLATYSSEVGASARDAADVASVGLALSKADGMIK